MQTPMNDWEKFGFSSSMVYQENMLAYCKVKAQCGTPGSNTLAREQS